MNLHRARKLDRRLRGLAALALATTLWGCASAPAPVPAEPAPPPPVVATLPALAEAAPPEVVAETAPPARPGPPAPRARLDPAYDAARLDLWERVRDGFAMPTLDNDNVRKWEQWYGSRPDYVQRMTERGSRYLFHIVEELERRNMPLDLALLPFVESAFNPEALSYARAAGMWQFMPGTGRDFELKQNVFRDDRRGVLASTRAALDYLQRLYTQFNDWQLALAAYNWGQGNVQKAIARNQRAGLPTNYDSLRMPDETRNYLPKLQAVKNIILRPGAYAIQLPELGNHPFFLTVPIERDIDVDLAARLAGVPLAEFQQLNPQMNKPVILAAGTPQVLLPYDNANRFLKQLPLHTGPLASWTAWVAPKNVSPAEAAQRVGMPEAQLREVNRIPPRMMVKAGSTLLVPRTAQSVHDVAEHIADNATMALAPIAPPLRRVAIKAGRQGETVAGIAKRYRVSAATVAQWNGVTPQAHFKPGQAIVVMLPGKAAPARVAAHGARRSHPAAARRVRVAQR